MFSEGAGTGISTVFMSDWDFYRTTNMAYMFYKSNITNATAFSNWDTRSVEDMSYMFSGNYFSALSYISDWDVRNVEDMNHMFARISSGTSITSLAPLSSWETDSLENMSYMFYFQKGIKNLTGLENWKTENVTNFNYTFSNTGITDASAINDWTLNSNATFTNMFAQTSSHPTFTKYPNGTWSSGTFTMN